MTARQGKGGLRRLTNFSSNFLIKLELNSKARFIRREMHPETKIWSTCVRRRHVGRSHPCPGGRNRQQKIPPSLFSLCSSGSVSVPLSPHPPGEGEGEGRFARKFPDFSIREKRQQMKNYRKQSKDQKTSSNKRFLREMGLTVEERGPGRTRIIHCCLKGWF